MAIDRLEMPLTGEDNYHTDICLEYRGSHFLSRIVVFDYCGAYGIAPTYNNPDIPSAPLITTRELPVP